METTHEEIWAMLRELIATQQEIAHRFLETDKKFQDTERLLKQQSQDTERLLKQQSQDTERLLKQQSQDTDRRIKNVTTQVGQLGNRLGQFVEEMVQPGLVRLFNERGIKVRQTLQNLTAHDEKSRLITQIDLLVLNTDVAIIVECKSQPNIEDVNEHLERLSTFKSYFPQYTNYRVFGAIAAMVLQPQVTQYAIRKGLYTLAQSGDAMAIRNEDGFIPKQW